VCLEQNFGLLLFGHHILFSPLKTDISWRSLLCNQWSWLDVLNLWILDFWGTLQEKSAPPILDANIICVEKDWPCSATGVFWWSLKASFLRVSSNVLVLHWWLADYYWDFAKKVSGNYSLSVNPTTTGTPVLEIFLCAKLHTLDILTWLIGHVVAEQLSKH